MTRFRNDLTRRGRWSPRDVRRALGHLLKMVPEMELLKADPETRLLIEEADDKVYNIVQLIYRVKSYEGTSKDYEFSRLTMEEPQP